ncbi:hypothetical protein BGW41_005122 [Actinomortierella wolfii]|nr:hypothetical protein BGW41_005122 [Actinomortierella wolfii]
MWCLVWAFTSSFNHLGSALLPATNALSDSIAATANMIGESSSAPYLDRRPGSPISPQSPMSPFPPSPCPSSILGVGINSPSRAMSLSSNSLASLTSLTMPGNAFTSPHPTTVLQHSDGADGYATPPFPTTPPFPPVSPSLRGFSGPSSWSLGDIMEDERMPPPLSGFADTRDSPTAHENSRFHGHNNNNNNNNNNSSSNNINSNNKASHRLSFLSINGSAASQLVRNSFETVTSTVSNITGFCTRRVGGGFEKRRNSCPATGGSNINGIITTTTITSSTDTDDSGPNNNKKKEKKSATTASAIKRRKDKWKKKREEKGKRKMGQLQVPTVEIERPKDPFLEPFKEAVEKVALPAMLEDLNHQHSRGYNLEIQLCISDAGFTLDSVEIPPGVEIHAYCGHQDKMVPLEASREMAQKCRWKMHEFIYSGHGGPRMLMTALEDLALADPS